jgi:DNA helicase II / ATP-dependent DNA helicase PcrA
MHSARDISQILGLPEPTDEQSAVIEASPTGVARVIAGAGSGKTETMALRVLWLVANSHVAPDGLLGLTFTRKAAGELSGRIQSRLRSLHERGLAPGTDEFHAPSVSTYNSFAARLYRENAVLLGRDPDATVLSEASAWALATAVVSKSSLPELETWDITVSSLVRMVRTLGARLQENRVAASDMEAFVETFRRCADLPAGGRGAYAQVEEWVGRMGTLSPLMSLVDQFQEAKRVRGVLEFSDQIALALSLVEQFPHVGEALRQRHQVVLLDEYQDTSVAQTTLLRSLFADHPVMAVGDPHQAIYGWRGASNSNLSDVVQDFGATAQTFSLSTSWRNGVHILEAANVIALPLRDLPGPEVDTLKPAPQATTDAVEVIFTETVEEEAEAVAARLASALTTTSPPPSAAIIVRARAHQRAFVDALSARGVPVHVLGIGGLLDDPAIADIVCTLRIIANSSAETELVRLLAGAKWRLGVSDLHALAGTARWLQGRDVHGVALDAEVAARLRESVSVHDAPGLVDALGFMALAPDNHSQWRAYSEESRPRLKDAYATLLSLSRGRMGDLDSLVAAIEAELGLAVEVAANPLRVSSRAARDAFYDALRTYVAVADDSSVAGFVQWLDDAERRDNLTPRAEPAEPGCVQVLTIHGAKGLEWDMVVIPRMVEDEVPAKPRETSAWLTTGELPYDFRGDKESLPVFSWRNATTKKELVDSHKEFVEAVKQHRGAEERRLMYVAITRARHQVVLSGSFWAHHTTPRGPSLFLEELAKAAVIGELPRHPQNESPPERVDDNPRVWPGDPLGRRRPSVEKAAELVREAAATSELQATTQEVKALMLAKERDASRGDQVEVTIPIRIPASSLERWYLDSRAQRLALARPLPQKPFLQALRGTLFHRFVEEHFEAKPRVALPGLDDGEGDSSLGFEEWVAAFTASPFAQEVPLAIEQELHVPLAGRIVICKLDAVFSSPSGPHIVDWKTGAMPTDPEDIRAKSLQLAAYRAAWAQWSGVEESSITASFWYAGTATLLTPEALPSREELEATLLKLWSD